MGAPTRGSTNTGHSLQLVSLTFSRLLAPTRINSLSRLHIFLFPFRFGDDYVTLKARVLKTLCDAIGTEKPLETRFGGMVAISSFGPKAVDSFLLHSIITYWQRWEHDLDQGDSLTVEEQEALEMCQYALLVCIKSVLRRELRVFR